MTPTDTDHLDNQFIALLTIVAAELPAAAAAIGLTATDNLEAAVLDPLIKEVASRSRSQLTPIKGEHNRLENFRNPVLDRVLGPIDLTFRTEDQQTVLGEVKWSGATKGPGLIYEQAWDAVKLAAAIVEHSDVVRGYVIGGASEAAWKETSTPDVFQAGTLNPAEAWLRNISRTDPTVTGRNGKTKVGLDLEAESGGRVLRTPLLKITAVTSIRVDFDDQTQPWFLRCAAVEPEGETVEWADMLAAAQEKP